MNVCLKNQDSLELFCQTKILKFKKSIFHAIIRIGEVYMEINNKVEAKCPNCGAPISTEICPYCQSITGLDTQNANMEYPVIECKETTISFWTTVFPAIFAVSFGFFGFIFPLIFLLSGVEYSFIIVLISIPFVIIGLVASIIVFRNIFRYFLVKTKGKEIEATVYGYMNDNLYLNDEPAQIVKLLINTKEGYRFILYQLGSTKHPYKINSKIKLMVYEDKFLILKNNKYYF